MFSETLAAFPLSDLALTSSFSLIHVFFFVDLYHMNLLDQTDCPRDKFYGFMERVFPVDLFGLRWASEDR